MQALRHLRSQHNSSKKETFEENLWQSEGLAGLEKRLDQARNLGKHLFIWDKTG